MLLLAPALVLCLLASQASGHRFRRGQCPQFTPAQNFDWSQVPDCQKNTSKHHVMHQFSAGTWFVTRKFAARKSQCLTNDFATDANGVKTIKKVTFAHYY